MVPDRDGGPDLSRNLRWGGNFASTNNVFFWALLDGHETCGIRILDKPQEAIIGETRIDIA
jgi:hypothetical protein